MDANIGVKNVRELSFVKLPACDTTSKQSNMKKTSGGSCLVKLYSQSRKSKGKSFYFYVDLFNRYKQKSDRPSIVAPLEARRCTSTGKI